MARPAERDVADLGANDEISEAGRKARFKRWEQLGLDVIRTDLEATGGLRMVGGPARGAPIRQR
jgi:hypothetical protein